MSELPQFLLAAVALIGSPGPNTLSVAATGAAFGPRAGIRYMIGLDLGVLAVIVLTGTGIAALVFAVPGVAPVITAFAVAYFLWLAWRIATAPPLGRAEAGRKPPRLAEGVALSLMNPKAYAAMAALFSGFALVADRPGADTVAKTAALICVVVVVNILWLVAGAGLTRLFQSPPAARALNLTFAAALLASVAAVTLL